MSEPEPDSKDRSRSGAPRFRWFRLETISLAELMVQIVAVIVGILLALAINAWTQSRHQRHAASLAMQSIFNETSINLASLRQHMNYLESMADTMEKSPVNRQTKGKQLCYDWNGWSGLRYPKIVDAAYQTAISTQAMAHMPLKQVENVAEVYSSLSLIPKIYDFDARMLMLGRPQSLPFCTALVRDIANTERLSTKRLTRFMRQYGRDGTASKAVSGSP